jgi:hypothetical protein
MLDVHSRWSPGCAAFLITFMQHKFETLLQLPLFVEVSHFTWAWDPWTANLVTPTKLLHLPFLMEVSHEMVSPETSRATISSPWASQIFCDRSHSPLALLGLSDRGVNFEIARATFSSLWAPRIALVVVRCLFCYLRSCAEILARRSFTASWRRGLATGTSYRDLVYRDPL